MLGFALVFAAYLLLCTGIALAAVEDDQSAAGESSTRGAAPQSPAGPEIVSERTATSETFQLPDGKRLTKLYTAPVHYRASDGQWEEIDLGLSAGADGKVRNEQSGVDLVFPERLGAEPVRLSSGEHWISYRLLNYGSGRAEIDGPEATYSTDDPGVDINLTSLPTGVKEDIEISDPTRPNRFTFELEASGGLEPRLTEARSIEFSDQKGIVVWKLPAPLMIDSATPIPARSDAVRYDLQPRDEGGWLLAVEADQEWLRAKDRSWPVSIDPTIVQPKEIQDCEIRYYGVPGIGSGQCSSSGYQNLYLYDYGQLAKSRLLLRFDLGPPPVLPPETPVVDANVALYSPSEATNLSGFELRRVAKEWTTTAEWFNYTSGQKWTQPGGDYYPAEGAEVLTANRGFGPGWWNFSSASLASLAQLWVANSKSARAWGLLGKTLEPCTGEFCEVQFASSKVTDTGKRPKLELTYYPPAPSSSKVTSPSDGTKTAKRFLLTSAWEHSGVDGLTYQYKNGQGYWINIPGNQVIDQSNQPVTWPQSVKAEDRESRPLYWDASSVTEGLAAKKVPIRAILTGSPGAAGYTKPVIGEINRHIGGPKDATTGIGPGNVDLMTGNFTISRTDLSIPSFNAALEFSRSFSSREAGVEGVLGPGWKPTSPLEEAGGSSWAKLVLKEETEEFEEESFTFKWAELSHSEGGVLAFEENGSGQFETPKEVSGYLLYRNPSSGSIELTDPAGNRTVFSNGGSGNEYLPSSVAMTGGPGNKSRMIYELVGGKRRLLKVIGPAAPGVSCPDEGSSLVNGCRLFFFNYGQIGASGSPTRLLSIDYHASGHGGPWNVAKYSYDSQGRLIAAWDPRLPANLKETYTYNATGQIATLTPSGQEPWTMAYGTLPGGTAIGRLTSVKRPSLVAGTPTAQTTIAYEVPVSGPGAPYGMGGEAVATWGQEDLPTDATAIFPPDEVPADPPSSFTRATVHYMDAEGQISNLATPSGAGTSAPSITTTETDEFGNVVRELTAQNRLRALAAGAGSPARSREVDTRFIYSKDGTELQEEKGPMHQVRLNSGTTTQARLHRSVQYDKNAPSPGAGETKPHLPTTETTGALLADGSVVDKRSTEYRYNWKLRKPTETISDPEGSEETKSVTVYDETSGLPTEIRQPKNAAGGGAGTTKIIYYKSGSMNPSACEGSLYAGLPCKVEPAAQPGTAGQPQLLVKKFPSYNLLGQALEVTESPGGGTETVRKVVNTYDAAGRQKTSAITGGGVAVPKTATQYSPTTGAATAQRFLCESACGTPTYSSAFGSPGSGAGQLKRPIDVALDASGNRWILDRENNRFLKFDAEGTFVSQFGSAGSGNGQFSAPSGIEVSPNGHIWVADSGNTRIQEFDQNGAFLKVVKFNAGADVFDIASGPAGVLWVSDRGLHRVVKLSEDGATLGLATGKQAAPGGSATDLSMPTGIATDAEGNVWVADNALDRILKFDSSGKFVSQFGSTGSGSGQLDGPVGIDIAPSGNVVVVDSANNRVEEFLPNGTYLRQFGTTGSGAGQFTEPRGLTLGPGHTIIVADAGNKRIQKWTISNAYDDQAVATTYDALGRVTSFQDADDNTSTVTYDLLGRPVTTSDGKGTQTMKYDPATGLLVELEDSAAGTFTASYNADGQLVKRGLPNGLTAEAVYDEAGAAVELSYTKSSNCGLSCDWLSFGVERSIDSQILLEDGTLGKDEYAYDKLGRLVNARETPNGGTCTTRTYKYDKDSNREEKTTIPAVAGVCSSSGGTTQKYSYDSADRLLGEGLTYDPFGRITNLPAGLAGGKALSTTYFSNDLVAIQSQNGVTNTFQLDSTLRQRQRLQAGGLEGIEAFHYAGPGDSPAWTQRGSTWARNIVGIGGELAAVQESGKEVQLQLTNLHGDVVATAASDPAKTSLLSTFRHDEFGVPVSGEVGRFGWLGGKQRRTELASGVIQMGARSYIPQLGRFLTPDPIFGGSANAYDYADQDPVNRFDLNGKCHPTRNRRCPGPPSPREKRERSVARSLARKTPNRPSIVIQCRRCGGASSSSIRDTFHSVVDKVSGAVDGAKTRFTSVGGSVYATITAPSDAFKAAGDAFKLAGNWNPDRLIQAWQCGWYASGGSGTIGDCDPYEIVFGPPDIAR